jgi:hypothetical protein
MKKFINNILLYLNCINRKTLLVSKTVNILKFAVNSTMPEYVMTMIPDNDKSDIVDTKLVRCMKKVSIDYMGWESESVESIIDKLKNIKQKQRTSFWILLAAELNMDSDKKQLEKAIIETQKAYLLLKQNIIT